MPKFIEDRLRAEAASKGLTGRHADRYVYGAMNNIGAMHGNQETAKGRHMEAKHEAHKVAEQLHAHAKKHGQAGAHAEAYAKGALMQRHGMHQQLDHGHLISRASAHGFAGEAAKAYAMGAQHEAQGMHAQPADDGEDDGADGE